MAAVPANLSAFGDLIDESIQQIYTKRRDQPNKMQQYFNVGNTKSYYTKDSSVISGGNVAFMGENASVQYDSPVQGYDKTYTQKKYGLGVKFTDQLWKFGLDMRGIAQRVDGLMDSVEERIEDDAADMLNNGYSTSYTDRDGQTVSTAGGDAVAYFSASHTREDGGTAWNNVVYDGTTYNMDFEYDALKAVRRTGGLVLTGKGQQFGVEYDTIVCKFGSSVHSRYEELQAALSKNMIPGGNQNDGAAKVGLPKLITLKYLDNDAYFFVFDSSKKNDTYGLQWLWSQKPTLDAPEYVYDTDEYKRKVTMFYDRGANDMRGWAASKGTNAA